MGFKNKTVWITGASSGIGKALAIEFSRQDANIIISARNKSKLEEVQSLCKNKEKVKVLSLDLTDFDSFKDKTEKAINLFNGIDILVNNGGISQRSLAINTIFEVDKNIFDVNYFGAITLTKTILPHFISKNKGQFVVISSILGKIGTPLRTAYAGSKHALHGFFDSLRAEVYNNNIDVTLITPGFVNTNVSKNALTADGSKHNQDDQGNINGMQPEDFAKKALKSIDNKKQEVVIAGLKERMALYLKRFFPSVLSSVIRKVNVT